MTIEIDNGVVNLSAARQAACIEAVLELESLCEVLPALVPEIAGVGGPHHVVRCLAERMVQLTSALVVGLGDTSYDTALLEQVVQSSQ